MMDDQKAGELLEQVRGLQKRKTWTCEEPYRVSSREYYVKAFSNAGYTTIWNWFTKVGGWITAYSHRDGEHHIYFCLRSDLERQT